MVKFKKKALYCIAGYFVAMETYVALFLSTLVFASYIVLVQSMCTHVENQSVQN